jgi:aryl-alcohol dehydrogenase-like predicted oxidoreductase
MSNLAGLDSYRLLGRSGLRVSPLALGAMTFGKEWGWGADKEDARRIFDVYVERGGNFVDTANLYTRGTSESLLGEFCAGRRDRLVIATKYSLTTDTRDPNASGNQRKNMMRAVEASLKRLATDHIDLFYMHAWDACTPVEEILRGMDDLVRAGKVVYLGLSDIPAWQAARMQTIADLRGWAPLIAMQVEYSLVARTAERDLIPMARALGLGVIPWSPQGAGVLSGKYSAADLAQVKIDGQADNSTRKSAAIESGYLTARNLAIADVVKSIAVEIEKTPSQVALAWTLLHDAVTSPIMGVRTMAQLEDNLGAVEVQFSKAQKDRLHEVSAIELGFPHDFLASPRMQSLMGVTLLASRQR